MPFSSSPTPSLSKLARVLKSPMIKPGHYGVTHGLPNRNLHVCRSAGLEGSAPQYATLGVGVMNVFMTFVSLVLVEKAGRKTLLMTGFIGMMVSVILLFLCLTFKVQLPFTSRFSLSFSLQFTSPATVALTSALKYIKVYANVDDSVCAIVYFTIYVTLSLLASLFAVYVIVYVTVYAVLYVIVYLTHWFHFIDGRSLDLLLEHPLGCSVRGYVCRWTRIHPMVFGRRIV